MSDQMEDRNLDLKQAKKYAEDLSKMYVSLKESESRYRALFEYSPISLWEEDLSEIKTHMDGLRNQGIQNLKQYFSEHGEVLIRLSQTIKILDVNQATLELYGAITKADLSRCFNQIMTHGFTEVLKDKIINLAEGKLFETECIHRKISGKEITVLMKASIPPGFENSWSKVLISVYDLTQRQRADFLQGMFGRYLSEEVMTALLENPESLRLGGEKRKVTIMISDLRGFTALSERISPEQLIQMLNNYFEVMVDILLKYNATINEISGDEMLVLFGAPQHMPDRNERAIACAIDMQNNMEKVNAYNRQNGLPELEMGIGLNNAEVIIGNVGSIKRSKFGVVGSDVNMTSRIESYAVGGQILVSRSVLEETSELVRIDSKQQVTPKGVELPITIYEVGGIGPPFNMAIEEESITLQPLMRKIPIRFTLIGGKHILEKERHGRIVRLSSKNTEIEFDQQMDLLSNIKMNLADVPEGLATKHFYGKLIAHGGTGEISHIVRFTSTPPEIASYFLAHIQHGQGGY